jgi:protein phosphatase
MHEVEALLDLFWSNFAPLLALREGQLVTDIGVSIPVPEFPLPAIVSLCKCAIFHFRSVPVVLRIPTEVSIVGDIHGNLRDVVRILQTRGLKSRFLFLGDYVDRGPFSLEVMLLLLTLCLKFPDQFALLRGNHETSSVARAYGFHSEVRTRYPESLFTHFCDVFSWIPLCAIVQGSFFCVHGGISPLLETISEIEILRRPILDDKDDRLIRDLLWSDPTEESVRFTESPRGATIEYGALAVRTFLQANGLEAIIRGHQCVDGVVKSPGMPVWTVFSSSNYAEDVANGSAILTVTADKKFEVELLEPIPMITRAEALFQSGRGEEAGRSHLPQLIGPARWNSLPSMGHRSSFKCPRQMTIDASRRGSVGALARLQRPIPLRGDSDGER